MTLKSADPEDEPLLYPNYLSEEEDVIDLRNALRETRRILMQPAFDEFRGDPVKPGPEINIDDDEELDNWIRENGETLYHPVSTCKMGNDEMSSFHHYPSCMYSLDDKVFLRFLLSSYLILHHRQY